MCPHGSPCLRLRSSSERAVTESAEHHVQAEAGNGDREQGETLAHRQESVADAQHEAGSERCLEEHTDVRLHDLYFLFYM